MARGGDDSDEERHDRFRSERNASSGPRPLFASLNSKRTTLTSGEDRRFDRRRSRERDRSRSRRSRERSWDRRRDREESVSHTRDREESLSHSRRRSGSGDRDDKKRKRHKERRRSTSDDRSKQSRRNRSSSERRSDSRSSHDSRSDRRHSKRPRKIHDEKSGDRVDTFMQRFERRRESSIEEEIVDNHLVVYCEGSTSPERSKHKKRKNGEKLKKKEKRKEKKEKRKEKKKGSVDNDGKVVSDNSPDRIDLTEDDVLPKEPSPELDSYGPKIPPKTEEKIIGPVVPSSSPEETLPGNRSTDSSQKDFYGPVAPSTLENPAEEQTDASRDADAVTTDQGKTDRIYGPALPIREAVVEAADDSASYGPALPPRLKKPKAEVESDDDGSYGPLPAGLGGRTQEELEMRAALIRRQLENQDCDSSRPKKREEWMLELPDAKRAEFGLGPRKFRAREGPDMSNRSSWTETPEEKRRKEELARLGVDLTNDDEDNTNSQRIGIIERDKEMEKKARQGKKKDKSLLEIHQKELKKKKKKEHKERGEKKEERRPFNRELDLQTNRFDEAQKRSIIKKAQLLDSRFSRGESKYL